MNTSCGNNIGIDIFLGNLKEILHRTAPPDKDRFTAVVRNTFDLLRKETPDIRPVDSQGLPGGIIKLHRQVPTIIVPDIHARAGLLYSVLTQPLNDGETVAQRLNEGTLQVVCVGDGLHSEERGASRWKKAYHEFLSGYKKHKAMDEEMKEGFAVMEMVMLSKKAFPGHFHFLKGNHENIANERGGGNSPFRKFALEGAMVLEYVTKFYGEDFLKAYYNFEKELPLFAVGEYFLISHAEPAYAFSQNEILEYRRQPEVVMGLTWTSNDAAESGSVASMLKQFLGEETAEKAFYFGGHRPVKGLYDLRAGGKYVQICTPDELTIALIRDRFDPEKDIVKIDDRAKH